MIETAQDASKTQTEIIEWLTNSNQIELIEIFDREKLLQDWDFVKRLNIPLLHSIHVPLGICFKFAGEIQKRFPSEQFKMMPEDLQSTALSLFEWIKANQEHDIRKRERPVWVGSLVKVKVKTTISTEQKQRKKIEYKGLGLN
jgi:hypothetical protein